MPDDLPDHTRFIPLSDLRPCVDFAAVGDQQGPTEHRYRIPGQHFLLVERGQIIARTGTATVVAEPGDILIFPPMAANRYRFDRPTRYWEAHIHFSPPPHHGRQIWLDGIGPLPVRLSLGDAFPRMRRAFETICAELPLLGASARIRVIGAVWEMLAVLSDAIQPGAARLEFDCWQRMRLRLAQDLRGRITIRALAADEHMSTAALIRGFQRRFGLTPGQYRAQQRLRQAALRLRRSSVAIKTIARESGFTDAYAFSRAFRRHLGVLPSQLRRGTGTTCPDPEHPLLRLNQGIVPVETSIDIAHECAVR